MRILEIETFSGRDVSKLSGFTREAEIIIPRGAALLVTSRRFVSNPDGTRCLHVRLRELPSSHGFEPGSCPLKASSSMTTWHNTPHA